MSELPSLPEPALGYEDHSIGGVYVEGFDAEQMREYASRAVVAAGHEAPITWRCFHCDEAFSDREAARLHFGESEMQRPMCTIDAAHFRWMEAQHRRNVDSEALRTIASLASAHEDIRRRAEEDGYARGLRDAKRHPGELGLMPVPAA